MRRSRLETLRCPVDRGPLLDRDARPTDRRIEAGRLKCGTCHRDYPVVEGIAMLLPPELRDDVDAGSSSAAPDASRRQMAARDEESGRYDDWYDDASYRFEIETYVSALSARPVETILDVGCGTGRITKAFAGDAAAVVGADFSLESLRFFARRLGSLAERVDLVQCDAAHLPFPDASFDAAVATSLFSNILGTPARDASLDELQRVLRPGGRLLVTVYNHAWLKRVRQRLGLSRSGLKEGFHSDGRVPYYNFAPAEFRRWVATRFEPGPVFGLNHRVPVLSRLSAPVAVGLDRLLAATPGSLAVFAKEMGLVARKP